MNQANKETIMAILRLHQEHPGGRYLWLPLCIPRSCSQACKELQEKVASRVASRKAKSLSQAGCTVLIQAVTSALPSYFMVVFLLAKEVLCDMDKTLKNFWWGFQDDHQRHFHLKAWSAICVPKELGCLGLCRMEDVNLPLLAKLGWKFITDKEAL